MARTHLQQTMASTLAILVCERFSGADCFTMKSHFTICLEIDAEKTGSISSRLAWLGLAWSLWAPSETKQVSILLQQCARTTSDHMQLNR